MDAVHNLEVTFRSLGGGSKEKMQEDWESIDLKKCLFSCMVHAEDALTTTTTTDSHYYPLQI